MLVALLDADVLVNAPVRDTLLRAAERDLYRLALTERLLEELQRALETDLGRTREQTEYLIHEIRRSFPEALVEGYEQLMLEMRNQEGDRHVLAAAVHARADIIVTFNVRDFPASACEPYGVTAQRPDEFLLGLWESAPEAVSDILREQAEDLRSWTLERLLYRLARDVPQFIDLVRNWEHEG